MIDRHTTLAKLTKRYQTSDPEAKARYRAGKAARKERQDRVRAALLSPGRSVVLLKADLRAAAVHLLWVRAGNWLCSPQGLAAVRRSG